MTDFIISSIRLQKRLTNPETFIKVEIPYIWQNQILIDFRRDKALPSGGLEEVLKYSIFNFFLNKVRDGALRILYGSLFQTVGAV